MKTLGIIPARFASTRFPGKPLIFIKGKTMVQRVFEQASKCQDVDRLVVATDDQRIFDHVNEFGGEAIMTSEEHRSGTDRCGEVLDKMDKAYDLVLNIQGDEPFIDPEHISMVIQALDREATDIATLAIPIRDTEQLMNANVPKVIRNKNEMAVYFSRLPIPFQRDFDETQWLEKFPYLKHIGLYGFKAGVLSKVVNDPPDPLELAESLEQLRWLSAGYQIHVSITDKENHTIDTPEDLKRLTQENN